MFQTIFDSISGYKTYITLGVALIDALGAKMGWWTQDSLRLMVEAIMAAIFTRMAIAKV